jgi:hypothetical protein
VVPASEVLDATHNGIIDGAHAWSGFWIGKDRAAVMVSSGPAGPFGMDWSDMWGWYYQGDGIETVGVVLPGPPRPSMWCGDRCSRPAPNEGAVDERGGGHRRHEVGAARAGLRLAMEQAEIVKLSDDEVAFLLGAPDPLPARERL